MQNNWVVTAASAIGKSHIDHEVPNQDAFAIKPLQSGFTAAVSDGAGSAKHSHDGSQFFVQKMVALLEKLHEQILNNAEWPSESNISHWLQKNIQNIRNELDAQVDNLKDYHATIVAVLLVDSFDKCIRIQVGDSTTLQSRFCMVGNKVDYFDNLIIPQESKSGYANETHFLTQNSWQEHISIDVIDTNDIHLISLMTDGAFELVVDGKSNNTKVFRPFFGNVVSNLLKLPNQNDRNEMLHNAMSSSGTYRITGDDKTLVLLTKQVALEYASAEPLIDELEKNTASNFNDAKPIALTNNNSTHDTNPVTASQLTITDTEIDNTLPLFDKPEMNDKTEDALSEICDQNTASLSLRKKVLLGILSVVATFALLSFAAKPMKAFLEKSPSEVAKENQHAKVEKEGNASSKTEESNSATATAKAEPLAPEPEVLSFALQKYNLNKPFTLNRDKKTENILLVWLPSVHKTPFNEKVTTLNKKKIKSLIEKDSIRRKCWYEPSMLGKQNGYVCFFKLQLQGQPSSVNSKKDGDKSQENVTQKLSMEELLPPKLLSILQATKSSGASVKKSTADTVGAGKPQQIYYLKANQDSLNFTNQLK